MKKKTVKKRGRPPILIDGAICEKAEAFAAQGLTMTQIAIVLGMGRATLFEKQAEFLDFSDAIKKGRTKGIAAITNSLFNKALSGNEKLIMFYLKNRDPENWEDVQKRHYYGTDKDALFPKEYKIYVVHTDKPKTN